MDPCFGEVDENFSRSCGYPEYCQNGRHERKSFDRFSDDFCELILSYLEIDDKIRLQFVNSQWRRCIFNRVYQFDYPLELNDFGIKNCCTTTDKKSKYSVPLPPSFDERFPKKYDEKVLEISTDVLKKCKFVKKLKIFIDCEESLLKLISDNCKFLVYFEVIFSDIKNIKDEVLREFAQNCGNNLKHLKIGPDPSFLINYGKFLINIEEIHISIRDICMRYNEPKKRRDVRFDLILESFRFNPKLKKLNVLYSELNDNLLENIHLFCPKLESVDFSTCDSINDKTMHSLAKLQNLRSMKISGIPYSAYDITDSGVCLILKNCKAIERISFDCGIKITQLTFDTLIELTKNPKRKIKFSFYWLRFWEHSEELREKFNEYSEWESKTPKGISEKLIIEIREYMVGWCGTGPLMAISRYRDKFMEYSFKK